MSARSWMWVVPLMAMAAAATAAETVKVTVDGMVCAFCAQGIEKRLKNLPQTQGVYVSLARKLVAVSLKEGQTVTDEKLTQELADAGYAVRAITRTQESLQELKRK